ASDRPVSLAPRAAPPLAIKSVSLGAVRFVVTADGAKYLEGASLGNGFILKAIQDDGLILSDGDRDIIQDFGRRS
ncbi:MAG: EscD/YscD/HrpQ family type III secretion system periplasmic domain-containing protein, partial [Candidatus Competibacter sp.]